MSNCSTEKQATFVADGIIDVWYIAYIVCIKQLSGRYHEESAIKETLQRITFIFLINYNIYIYCITFREKYEKDAFLLEIFFNIGIKNIMIFG